MRCSQFHEIELRLLGYYLIDVGGEKGVGVCDLAADGALDGGFDFGLRAGGDAGRGAVLQYFGP